MAEDPIDKYMKMRAKSDRDDKSPFDHFDAQVHKRMTESELEKKLEGLPEKQRIKIIAELVKCSFLGTSSVEELKHKFQSLRESIKVVPTSLKFVYKFIPREGRDAYLDECVKHFINEGVINEENEYQKLWVKGRVLYGIASACGIDMNVKA